MPRSYRDLRSFLRYLEQRGEVARIGVPVSADLEITEIADRAVKQSTPERPGPALLFENVRGHSAPVLINTYASDRRMAAALGVDRLDDVGDRLRKLLKPEVPGGWLERLKKLGELKELASAPPRIVARGAVYECAVDPADLTRMPVLRCWPGDGGPYITLPMVISRDPRTGKRNVGMYRMQVFGPREAGMHWQLHKGGAAHFQRLERGRLEVAVAIGADPATVYAASAPLPPDIDEFLFAGFLRGEPIELVRARTVDLAVPAEAEFILEGYVDAAERRTEGPFGDHTGYYSLADEYPVFHLTAMYHRRDPIYMTTIVGKPPMEDYWLGKATERIFLPLLQLVHGEIVDVNMPAEGVFHNLVVVSIRKRFPGHPHKVMYGLWGTGQMMFARNIVVVDEDVDVQDLREVAFRVLANVDARRDLVVVDGPVDVLDHASPQPLIGGKLGIDATRKTAADGYTRGWPPDISMDSAVKARVDQLWPQLGL
ncbi:MAG: menaquinone biosynthesis decarboxylase [Planctomycetes bacterium]|nr:menaquinone biosynthesis decarboxylase [Planctomycetota bacterium]